MRPWRFNSGQKSFGTSHFIEVTFSVTCCGSLAPGMIADTVGAALQNCCAAVRGSVPYLAASARRRSRLAIAPSGITPR
jgi:hypothetical protein